MKEEIKQRIYSAIREEMSIDPQALDPDKELREQVELDSVQLVGLASRLESELDIELPLSVMDAGSFREFLQIIDETIAKAKK